MSPALLALLAAPGFAIVVVRRRSAAIALLAVQSLLLGVLALHEAVGGAGALAVPAVVLLARAVALPAALLRVVHATREPRRIAAEPFALGRLVASVALVLGAVTLLPPLGLDDAATWRVAVGLVVLGVAIAALRRTVVLQAIGALVAENGVYLASLAVAGGVPAAIELGVVCDLIVIVAVVAAFGTTIHRRLGSGDTSLLETLRD
jgi:hydrogenase-4 membrane subunit HyfE